MLRASDTVPAGAGGASGALSAIQHYNPIEKTFVPVAQQAGSSSSSDHPAPTLLSSPASPGGGGIMNSAGGSILNTGLMKSNHSAKGSNNIENHRAVAFDADVHTVTHVRSDTNNRSSASSGVAPAGKKLVTNPKRKLMMKRSGTTGALDALASVGHENSLRSETPRGAASHSNNNGMMSAGDRHSAGRHGGGATLLVMGGGGTNAAATGGVTQQLSTSSAARSGGFGGTPTGARALQFGMNQSGGNFSMPRGTAGGGGPSNLHSNNFVDGPQLQAAAAKLGVKVTNMEAKVRQLEEDSKRILKGMKEIQKYIAICPPQLKISHIR